MLQLMALLGWVPAGEAGSDSSDSDDAIAENIQPRFVHNKSGRYESRYAVTADFLKLPADYNTCHAFVAVVR
jgi:CobB/CobQ-like glutamine amidotransferase domain